MTSDLHVVVGAGPLGRAVVESLLARGRRVRVVSRSGATGLPPGVESVRGDVGQADGARAALAGAATVYQCAQPPYHRWPAHFPALQAHVVAGAAAAGAALVVAENLYGYGVPDGPLHEGLPAAATTRKGRVRAAMSDALFEAHRRGDIRATAGRASDFYGPGVRDAALGARVFPAVLRGRTARAPGDPDQPHTYTYIGDFGEALVRLGETEAAFGAAWHVPNAPTVTTRAVLERAFEIAGHPPRIGATGRAMMRAVGLFVPAARETVEMMPAYERPYVVSHARYTALLGDHATPLDVGLARTLDRYRAQAAAA